MTTILSLTLLSRKVQVAINLENIVQAQPAQMKTMRTVRKAKCSDVKHGSGTSSKSFNQIPQCLKTRDKQSGHFKGNKKLTDRSNKGKY